MTMRVRAGFIPLVDAATLVMAADHGFAEEAGLALELVPEVSWSNIRDKVNVGLFEAAHVLAPLAIASTLGLGHVRVPMIAPFVLAQNGNCITVSYRLYGELYDASEGDRADPRVTALALARVIASRKAKGQEPLTFAATFPFSSHHYQLRAWMAQGGVDAEEDVRVVILPPPLMKESLADGIVDGFCVGAPWNSVAVDERVGRILHLSTELIPTAHEKMLALRADWAERNPEILNALLTALGHAAAFVAQPENREVVARSLARPDRLGVKAAILMRTLEGRLKIAEPNIFRTDERYLVLNETRPDPAQAAFLFAQMVRWNQAPLSEGLLQQAMAVFRPDLHEAVLGPARAPAAPIRFFGEPTFSADDVERYLEAVG